MPKIEITPIPIFRIHARCGNHPCESSWFLSQKDAERYPDDDWIGRTTEERRAVIVGNDLFVMSNTGLHNPEHE